MKGCLLAGARDAGFSWGFQDNLVLEEGTTQKTTQKISEMELKILEVIKKNSGFSRNEIAEAIGDITPDGIKYHLSSLQKKRLLKRIGGRKEGYWKVLMQQLSADAEKVGSAEMTLDEINAEIAVAQSGK